MERSRFPRQPTLIVLDEWKVSAGKTNDTCVVRETRVEKNRDVRLRIPRACPRLRSQSPRSKPAKGPRYTVACINYACPKVESHTFAHFHTWNSVLTRARVATWYGTRRILAEFQTLGDPSTKNPSSSKRRATLENLPDRYDNLSNTFSVDPAANICHQNVFRTALPIDWSEFKMRRWV